MIVQKIELKIRGVLRLYEVPESLAWMNARQRERIWQALSARQKAQYQMSEHDNLITNGGLNDISNYLGNYSTLNGFALWLALGNGILNGVSASDTSLGNELVRVQPTSSTVTGNQTDISTSYSPTSTTTFTEGGLYGGNANSTANSGTLHSHLLLSASLLGTHLYQFDYLLIRN